MWTKGILPFVHPGRPWTLGILPFVPKRLLAADYRAASTCEDGIMAEVLSELIEPQHC